MVGGTKAVSELGPAEFNGCKYIVLCTPSENENWL